MYIELQGTSQITNRILNKKSLTLYQVNLNNVLGKITGESMLQAYNNKKI